MAALGIIKAFWLGQAVNLLDGSSLTLGGIANKPRVVGTRVTRSRSMEASEIKLKVAVETGLVISTVFDRGVEGELQVQCDSGQTFVWEGAFISGSLPITVGDSSGMDVTFGGGTPLEL